MENFNRDRSDIFSLEIDETVKTTFIEMARWTKFLSIMGFIFLGLLVVGGFFLALALTSMSSLYGSANPLAAIGTVGITLIYLLIASINFYPTYALLKYSTGIKRALLQNDKALFNTSLNYLKNMFKYIGILMIIGLCMYGLFFIIAIIAAAGRI